MVQKRAKPAPVKRKSPVKRMHRVMLSLEDEDHESLAQGAQEARLPISTYARVLVLKQLASGDSGLKKLDR